MAGVAPTVPMTRSLRLKEVVPPLYCYGADREHGGIKHCRLSASRCDSRQWSVGQRAGALHLQA